MGKISNVVRRTIFSRAASFCARGGGGGVGRSGRGGWCQGGGEGRVDAGREDGGCAGCEEGGGRR